MITELNNLIKDSDPIRLMQLIVDMEAASLDADILTHDDLVQLSHLHHMLGEVARQQHPAAPAA